MRINDIIAEATYGIDTRYTEQDLDLLFRAATDIAKVTHKNLGITIIITAHFKDQIRMKRFPGKERFEKITPIDLIDAFSKILNRGLTFFRGKDIGTNYIFFDKDTLLNVPLIKNAETRFTVPTIIKRDKYMAPGQKITL